MIYVVCIIFLMDRVDVEHRPLRVIFIYLSKYHLSIYPTIYHLSVYRLSSIYYLSIVYLSSIIYYLSIIYQISIHHLFNYLLVCLFSSTYNSRGTILFIIIVSSGFSTNMQKLINKLFTEQINDRRNSLES